MSCKPEPEVSWYHGHDMIFSSERYRCTRDRGMFRLEIDHVEPWDAGVWKALAVNSYGQALSSCSVTVIENVPPGDSGKQMLSRLIF